MGCLCQYNIASGLILIDRKIMIEIETNMCEIQYESCIDYLDT